MADTTLIDPLGRTVVLHDRTWTIHIVPGHPDVATERTLVEEAVTQPLKIHYDRFNPDRRHYYGRGPRPAVMILVVADIRGRFVATAHLVKKIRGGGEEWSQPTP